MSLQFVIGPPGSGKSEWCLACGREEALRAPDGPPIILLVPEQMSYLTERALLRDGFEGTIRARVFSFSRLGQWVFSQSPAPALPRLNDVHRRVLVTAIIAAMKSDAQSGGLLGVRSIERAVAEMISELKQFRVTPDELEEMKGDIAGANPQLARKLDEIVCVAREYDRRVSGRFEDPEETLASLRTRTGELRTLEGAQVYVDGFYSFTPVELEVLRGLVKRCTRVVITLPMERERFEAMRGGELPREFSRTYMIEETASALIGMAADEGAELEREVILPEGNTPTRFSGSRGLAHLQAHFSSKNPNPWQGSAPGLRMLTAGDARGEARLAIEQILEWRDSHGWRWGEMAIVTRDIDRYAEATGELCRAAQIPVFLDRHEPLEAHPIIQGTIAALEYVMGKAAPEVLLEFAKSGLYDFDRDAVARTELFLLHHPQDHRAWHALTDWKEPPARTPFEDEGGSRRRSRFDMQEINRTRRAIAAPIGKLAAAHRECINDSNVAVPDFFMALCTFLHDAISDEHDDVTAAILREIGELFDSIIVAAGDEPIEQGVLLELLREIFGKLTLPRIPPTIDQLTVAQIDRSRLYGIRGAVVMGLAEGRFPETAGNATLLTDREREELYAASIRGKRRHAELRASSRRMFLREGFYGWMAFTRAGEALTVTRPRSDDAGQRLAPSAYWMELTRLFPNVDVANESAGFSLDGALQAREAAAALCRDVFRTNERDVVPPRTFEMNDLAVGLDEEQRAEFEAIVSWAGCRNEARLDPALANEFLAGQLRASVSALESFACCPFQYFVHSMLSPEIPVQPEMSPADVGNLAHATLKELTDELVESGQSFADIDEGDIPAIVARAMRQPIERLKSAGLFRRRSEDVAARLVGRQLEDVVRFLREAALQLCGRPLGTELRFGREGGLQGVSLRTRTENGGELDIVLRGQIDRVELMSGPDGRQWLAVMDYKLSKRKAEWAELADGKSLQLPVYLLVLDANRELLGNGAGAMLAGAFYVPVVWGEERPRRLRGIMRHDVYQTLGIGDESSPVLVSGKDPDIKTPSRGDVISDRQFDALIERARLAIERHAQRIASGEIEIRPSLVRRDTPCGYCEYRSACRLDYSMNSRRVVVALPQAEAIEGWLGEP